MDPPRGDGPASGKKARAKPTCFSCSILVCVRACTSLVSDSNARLWIPLSRFLPRYSVQGGPDMIRKEAWSSYRTVPCVRLCWDVEEPNGSKWLAWGLAARWGGVRMSPVCLEGVQLVKDLHVMMQEGSLAEQCNSTLLHISPLGYM